MLCTPGSTMNHHVPIQRNSSAPRTLLLRMFSCVLLLCHYVRSIRSPLSRPFLQTTQCQRTRCMYSSPSSRVSKGLNMVRCRSARFTHVPSALTVSCLSDIATTRNTDAHCRCVPDSSYKKIRKKFSTQNASIKMYGRQRNIQTTSPRTHGLVPVTSGGVETKNWQAHLHAPA